MKTTKCNKPKKRPLSVTYIFGSFFGAVMVALAFAYFNFEFSQYRFIDFSKVTFFVDRKLFIPKEDNYVLLVYSSKATKNIKQLLQNANYPVLAIDINQDKTKQIKTSLTTSINTILQVVQKFNIYTVPSVVLIKKYDGVVYKQDSKIQILKL